MLLVLLQLWTSPIEKTVWISKFAQLMTALTVRLHSSVSTSFGTASAPRDKMHGRITRAIVLMIKLLNVSKGNDTPERRHWRMKLS